MTEQEMMEIWQKMAAPGAEHAFLAKFTGNWKAAMKMWMAPGQPPNESTGTAKTAMKLGGRFRTEEFHCDMGGMSFDGWGMIGFDNNTRKFWLTWNDNMSTGIFHVTGELASDGKAIIFNGKMDKPMMKLKDVPTRNTYRFIDDNHFVFEAWDNAGTPQEYQTLEIKYSR